MSKFNYLNGIKKNDVMEKSFAHFDGELYVSNGWIDNHVHIFSEAKYKIDINTEQAFDGVVIAYDAGSTGYNNVDTAIEEVNKYDLEVFFWLNASPNGLITINELEHPIVDELLYKEAIKNPRVIGTKLRLSKQAIGEDYETYWKLIDLACTTDKPIMYHVGNKPPAFSDLVKKIRRQDVVTHFYHNKHDDIYNYAESVGWKVPFNIDIGWGNASLGLSMYDRMMEKKLYPTYTSTDMHQDTFTNKSVQIKNILAMLVDSGMTLAEAVKTVTTNPFTLIKDVYADYQDTYTVFRVMQKPIILNDPTNGSKKIGTTIVPVGTWVKGVFNEIN